LTVRRAERHARPALARLCARQSLLERPARVGVVEDLGPSVKHDLFDDVGHGVDVLKGIQRTPSVAPDVVAGRTATVLRRAGLMAGDAGRIGLTGDRLEPLLEPDLMAPGIVQVVLVGEPGARAQAQALQGPIRRGRRQLPRAVTGGAKAELEEMEALPAHGDLEDAVQLAQGAVGWRQHAPPHHRADKLEPKLQLQDGAGRRR